MQEKAANPAGGRRWGVPHTKVVPPRLPGNFVRRPGLCEKLTLAVATSPVTLVCAPAGCGKTLLLAEWMSTLARDAVWVSLDHDDDTAQHFLTSLRFAITEHTLATVEPALRHRSAPPGDAAVTVAELLQAIEALPHRLVVVLDNVQEIPGRDVLRVLAAVIRHQPRNLRLVLAARSDPLLPLAKLRVQGRLTEFRADALRFGPAEARELLDGCGVRLSEDQLLRLVSQTDGWAAGLRLAARSLRTTQDPDRFVPYFAGHDHAMADFLTGEVLAHLPGDSREILAMLSVSDRVTPRLAAALTGRDDVGGLLAGLEREGVLVTAVEGEPPWYQLHPLLRAYLRTELTRHQPDLVTVLHQRAARWFAGQDRPREALLHAEQTGDERAAAELLHAKGMDVLLDGGPGLVLRALDAAGSLVARDARLLLFAALAHLELGELSAAESDIARSSRVWPERPDEGLAGFRRLVVSAHGLACGRAPAPGGAGVCRSAAAEAWARLDHGVALLAAGDHGGAAGELAAADRLSDEQDLHYLEVHTKAAHALLAVAAGDDAGAAEASELALTLAGHGTWKRSPWLAVCRAILGFARLLRTDLRGALELAAGLDGVEPSALRFAGGVIEGAARYDGGDRAAGLKLLQDSRSALAGAPVPRPLAAIAMALEHQCALVLAQAPHARDAAEWGARRLGPVAEVHLTVARARFARGDVDGSVRALRAAREPGVPRLVAGTETELALLDAATALRLGCRTKARGSLEEALVSAVPAGIVRPFAYADPEVKVLLLDQMGGFGAAETFAARVRRVLTEDGAATAAVLTNRELVVLTRLTSPQPLDEVASELRVSVNTVKTHVRAIYAKLGVNNRRAAVVAARELGLG
ncbi:LuxR C-terminal-related transcriptional regulator [Amycolatopsis tucumanensis]|uniref:LuxR C-terminal-related transcriptional regulator n=1 Tax=Amycolatopsis tucumanensis TaxID=401106 RepID=UPI001F00D6EE|nr:LuxR C-terminal-related transcriptional regulator [Amycolatopsis tucumanensis]MCF6420688.1 LuxR C-terminal-related transcriptional regulator [Amycolatopsis tucumanensis]